MGRFIVGDVVAVKFPFSNLTGQKLRPALVLALAEYENVILCQITSKSYSSKTAIMITEADFNQGSLPVVSYARPDKIFTADKSIISKKLGSLHRLKTEYLLDLVRRQFEGPKVES